MATGDAKRIGDEPAEGVSGSAMALLVEAGAVLATSLDPRTTMSQVARLTVPQLADICTIDLLDRDGSITEAAVAASDPQIASALEELRARHPLRPDGEHPVARVIRSGEPELQSKMDAPLLRSFAAGAEHARFMVEHRYSSAAVAPLLARGRTLGALSALRLGDAEPYTEADMALISELARRAALAIDNARLFSDLRRIEQRLEAVLVNLAEAVTLTDEEGHVVFANQAAADLVGAATPSELIDGRPGGMMRRLLVRDEHGRKLGLESMPGRMVFTQQRDAPGDADAELDDLRAEPLLLRATVLSSGEERWLMARSSPLADPETGRLRWSLNIFEDITEIKRAQIAQTFLADATAVLSASMDFAETLRRVAELAVPQLAAWCAVGLLTDSGDVECVAVHHDDPSRQALAEAVAQALARRLQERGEAASAASSVHPRLAAEIEPDELATDGHEHDGEALMRELEASSAIVVPMVSTSRTIGAIVLGCSEAARRLSEADLFVAEELGRRAGTAIENARLYTERTRIAHTLQQALLPASLPTVPGAEIEVRYTPAGELNEAGGDFYDVIECERGRWLLVIGDVCGKGPTAAGVTALARHTLRAAALSGQTPLQMLNLLHRALRGQPAGADLCTVCLVSLEREEDGMRLGAMLAGHPQPLLIDRAGAVRPLGEPGTLLGVIDPIKVVERSANLREGETLLLYTDGVAEAGRSSGTLSEQGLIELCGASPSLSLSQLLASIEAAALERAAGMRRDDIALLGLRLSPTAR